VTGIVMPIHNSLLRSLSLAFAARAEHRFMYYNFPVGLV